MGVFKAAPQGVPPTGGSNIPVVTTGYVVPAQQTSAGLKGLREEVIGLRRDIQELIDLMRSL